MIAQEVPPIAREGLPYWIFWLLLCVIALLLAFIFLRDKELRVRVNEFLSGAKRRMKRAQLRIRLNRELRKKDAARRDLGKLAWSEKLPGETYAPHFQVIGRLEKEGAAKQDEMKDLMSRILELQKRQEGVRQKTKQTPKAKESGGPPDTAAALQDLKTEDKRITKEIRECDRRISAGRTALKTIERDRAAQFTQVGGLIDDARPEHAEFLGLYVQIDKLNRTILQYMNEIDTLS